MTTNDMIGEWVDELPKEVGDYLFYGNLWGEEEQKHHIVRITQIINGGLAVCDGNFWFDYSPVGKFAKIINLPTPNTRRVFDHDEKHY